MRFIVAVLFLVASAANAQVYKCVDPATGKTTFTDTACPDKVAGDYVPVKPANSDSGYPSDSEIAESQRRDEQVMSARHAEWEQLSVSREQREKAAAHERKAKRLSSEAEVANNQWEKASLMKQAQAERDAARGVSGSPPLKEPVPLSTAASKDVPHPSVITNCDPGGCWDTKGNRYNGSAGPTHIRQDGKVCQKIGGIMQCN